MIALVDKIVVATDTALRNAFLVTFNGSTIQSSNMSQYTSSFTSYPPESIMSFVISEGFFPAFIRI